VAKVSQWLTFRQELSDWSQDGQTGAGNPASLSKQQEGFVEHPLMFADASKAPVGFQRPVTPNTSRMPLVESTPLGSFSDVNLDDVLEVGWQNPSPIPSSRLPLAEPDALPLWDILATEDGHPLCDEDGSPLGIA
jgi:hypothetical protein